MIDFNKTLSMLYSARLLNKFMEWYSDRPTLIDINLPFLPRSWNKNSIKKIKINYYFKNVYKK